MEIRFHNEAEFCGWLARRHVDHRVRIAQLLDALSLASKPLAWPHGRYLGDGLHELKTGGGLRIYYSAGAGEAVILAQGNKSSQNLDIKRARRRQ